MRALNLPRPAVFHDRLDKRGVLIGNGEYQDGEEA